MRTTKSNNLDGRSTGWAPWLMGGRSRSPRGFIRTPRPVAAPSRVGATLTVDQVRKQIGTAAFAFRGYDSSNHGRGADLLAHPVYGPIVSPVLRSASGLCETILKRPVDLATRLRDHAPSTLDTFVEDIAMIVGLEIAQVRILEQVLDIPVHQARLSFGHSIGELAALVLGGVYEMEQLLPVPLGLAQDCAELTYHTTIGILSSSSVNLDIMKVDRLCHGISARGHGLIGPSTYLSPDHILLIGQEGTLDEFEREMREMLSPDVTLRRRPNHWPPLHTPLVWERNIPNRTAMAMHHITGGDRKPTPPIVSCATGLANYDQWNSRMILADWTDHPQRIWEAMENTLQSGAELVIHVGPEPKLIPSAFERLGARVIKQLRRSHLERLGSSVIPSMGRQEWIMRSLPGSAALLRAPYLRHMILEDWLLVQDVT